MKLYPNRILVSHRGKQLKHNLDGEGAASVPLALGDLAVEALLRELPPDNNAPGKTKIARYKLAKEIQKNIGGKAIHFMTISAEDLALVKSRIEAAFPALIVGPADEAIEAEVYPVGEEKTG